MYGDESAIHFVFRNKDAALKATSWDDFCIRASTNGERHVSYYHEVKWLPQYYETLKYHPTLDYIPKALWLPQAKCLGDIVTGLEYRRIKHTGHGFREAGHYIGSPLSASRGRHTYDPKRDVVTLHSAVWCNLYAQALTPACSKVLEGHMMEGPGSFDCTRWPDGRYLVICRDISGIGECWITLLPADYDFMTDITQQDREFITADIAGFEEAIKDAPETSTYKKAEGK